jgi:hypothetical protein
LLNLAIYCSQYTEVNPCDKSNRKAICIKMRANKLLLSATRLSKNGMRSTTSLLKQSTKCNRRATLRTFYWRRNLDCLPIASRRKRRSSTKYYPCQILIRQLLAPSQKSSKYVHHILVDSSCSHSFISFHCITRIGEFTARHSQKMTEAHN